MLHAEKAQWKCEFEIKQLMLPVCNTWMGGIAVAWLTETTATSVWAFGRPSVSPMGGGVISFKWDKKSQVLCARVAARRIKDIYCKVASHCLW